MATITNRGAYIWQAKVRRRGYPRISKTFSTRAKAERWARMMETEMDDGVFVSRKEAERSRGSVIFYLLQKPTESVLIPDGTYLTAPANVDLGTNAVTFIVRGTKIMDVNNIDYYYNPQTKRYEIEAQIEAQIAGSDGNVPAETITLVTGLNTQIQVVNTSPTQYGSDLESNYDYGYIELSTDNGTTWSQLISFNGTSSNWVRYSTTLNYPVGTQVKIRFRLDTDGSVVREGWYVDDIRVFDPLGVTEVTGLVATEVSELFRISPNPFKRVSAISYQLARASRVALSVYDVSGRLVKALSAGQELIEPGYYTVSWDGSDEQGRAVPAGVYFVKFESADHASVQKAILLR